MLNVKKTKSMGTGAAAFTLGLIALTAGVSKHAEACMSPVTTATIYSPNIKDAVIEAMTQDIIRVTLSYGLVPAHFGASDLVSYDQTVLKLLAKVPYGQDSRIPMPGGMGSVFYFRVIAPGEATISARAEKDGKLIESISQKVKAKERPNPHTRCG